MTIQQWLEQETNRYTDKGIEISVASGVDEERNQAHVSSVKTIKGAMGHPKFESFFNGNTQSTWTTLK